MWNFDVLSRDWVIDEDGWVWNGFGRNKFEGWVGKFEVESLVLDKRECIDWVKSWRDCDFVIEDDCCNK